MYTRILVHYESLFLFCFVPLSITSLYTVFKVQTITVYMCYVFTIGLLDLVIIIGDQFIEPYGSSGSLPLLSRV